jgi:hypothetical protein
LTRFTRGIDVEAKELEPVMVRRLKEDLRRLGQPFPERVVEPIRISGLPPDAPELRLATMLDEYRQSSAGGAQARFLFANLQQRLFSSIAAFHRTLTTHRKTLLRKRQDEKPSEIEAEVELLEDNDLVEIATQQARAELGDLDAAIAHVDRMLAVSGPARDSADARVNAILDWIEAEMLDASHAWRDRPRSPRAYAVSCPSQILLHGSKAILQGGPLFRGQTNRGHNQANSIALCRTRLLPALLIP